MSKAPEARRPPRARTITKRIVYVSIFFMMFTGLRVLRGSGAAPATPPKLVVLIVVDQMRADYVDRFTGAWNAGFKRMVDAGRVVHARGVSVSEDADVRRPRDNLHRRLSAHARRLPERVVGPRAAPHDDLHAGSERRRHRLRNRDDRRRLGVSAAGADLHRSDAHRTQVAHRVGVAQGAQRDHARRPRRRRRRVAHRCARRLGNVEGLRRGAGARGEGVR